MRKKRVLTTAEKQRKYLRQKQLQEEKRELFLDYGWKPADIKTKYLRWSWKKIQAFLDGGLVYECGQFLYVGWCDKSENYSAWDISDQYLNWSNEEIKRFIEEILDSYGKDNSEGRAGHVSVIYGGEKDVHTLLRINENKGYETLCFSDRFTLKGLLQVTAFSLSNSTEENRQVVYTGIRNFLKKNNRELYNEWKI